MNKSWLAGGLFGLVVVVALVALAIKIRRTRHPVSDPLICCTVGQDMRSITLKNAEVHAENRNGVNSLVVRFDPSAEASIAIQAVKPWNWSGYGSLTMRVTNPSSTGQRFFARLDQSGSNAVLQYMTGFAPPNSTNTFVALVDQDLESLGIQQLAVNYHGMLGLVRTTPKVPDLGQMARLKLYVTGIQSQITLTFDNIKMGPPIDINQVADRFGQNRFVDWPGKITDEKMLADNAQKEQADLNANPGIKTDAFGGWPDGPKMPAKAHYYVAKWGKKWLFVTPLGNPMFMMGINAMSLFEPTIIDGRKSMYQDLPSNSGPLSDQFRTVSKAYGPVKGGTTFNFYGANVERKYGVGYDQAWRNISALRMKSWGFNTIVNSLGGGQRLNKIPYVLWTSTTGQFDRVSSADNHWAQMPDPFDPDFASAVRTTVERATMTSKDDPYCMGYAIDNELSWGGFGNDSQRYALAYGALAATASKSPAKRSFLDTLRAKYGTVSRLDASWSTRFTSWSDLEQPVKLSVVPSTDLGGDMSAFVTAFADKYFSIVKSAVKQADPDRLYFGCRLAFFTPEVIKVCAEYVDVMSVNLYAATPDPAKFGYLKSLDKPVMFSECGSGATDRGALGYGIFDAGSQKDRADALKSFVNWSIDTPSIAGCAWFQYIDQPPTGRTVDGQNCGIGLVDITDQPYPDIVRAARSVTHDMYKKLLGGQH